MTRARPRPRRASPGSGSCTSSTSCRCPPTPSSPTAPAPRRCASSRSGRCGGSATPRSLTFLFGSCSITIQGDGENMDLYLEGARRHRDPHRHAPRHHDVPQRVGRDLAQPEDRDRQRRERRRRRRGEPRRARRGQGGRPSVALQHPVLDPHAVVHGVRRPRRTVLRRQIGEHVVYWCSSSCCGRSSRRRRSGSSAASTAPSTRRPSTSTSDTIIFGFVLLAVIYFVGWELLLGA